MKKYIVEYRIVGYMAFEVEAKDIDEAIKIGDNKMYQAQKEHKIDIDDTSFELYHAMDDDENEEVWNC